MFGQNFVAKTTTCCRLRLANLHDGKIPTYFWRQRHSIPDLLIRNLNRVGHLLQQRIGAEINVPGLASLELFIGAILSFNCVTESKHEIGYLFGVLSCLFSPLLISKFKYPFALPMNGKSCRLNDNAPVLVAEPLQIQSLLPSRWWRIACIGSLNKFYVRTFEVLQRLIRRDVADDATLIGCDARDVIQWLGPTRNCLLYTSPSPRD